MSRHRRDRVGRRPARRAGRRHGVVPVTSGILLDRHVGDVKAVDGVSLTIGRGETLGLVGESGCGKSTLGRAILRLYEPTVGPHHLRRDDITSLNDNELRPIRRRMQMVFQDPYASLNPRHSVGRIVGEPLRTHGATTGRETGRRVQELLEVVGLPGDAANRYPHEFSGGQRQRIGLARALASEPPVPRLRRARLGARRLDPGADREPARGASGRVRSHVLVHRPRSRSRPAHLGSDRRHVPREGRRGRARRRPVRGPLHPYTITLLSAIPIPDPEVERARRPIRVQGDLPSPANPPNACRFHTRCPFVQESLCRDEEPVLREVDGHLVACHFVEDIKAGNIVPHEREPTFDPGLQPVPAEPPPD